VLDNTGDVVTENADEGTDLVRIGIATANQTYTLGDNVENGALINTVAFHLTGNTLDNVLTGNAAINTLTGGEGNDTLTGGAGADTLIGGSGDDSYVIDNALDNLIENDGEGTDSVQSSITYTLAANLEHLTLTGAAAINATGNELDNILTGNAGANILNGGGGADTLIGGNGNDTYVVDDVGDFLSETNALAAGGNDLVQAALTYTLGDNLERLTLTGTAAINGTGNGLANTLTGNDGNNTLDGGAGADTLIGGLGDDTLIGGLGDDTYLVDLTATGTLQDALIEAADAGTDSMVLRGSPTLVNAATLTLADNLENFDASATGSTKLNLTGNALANVITGNAGNNTLNGDAGADTLDGGAGVDTLIGGLGDDTFRVDLTTTGALQDTLIEAASAGTDTVLLRGSATLTTAATLTLAANLENINASTTGSTKLNLTGNALANTLTGNAADNILDGGTGADLLIGGLGNDTYVIDNATDGVTELSGQGTDLIKVNIATANQTYTLGNHVENGTLINAVAFNLAGNTLNNLLTGNAAANALDGGSGADTLTGGAGDDIFIFSTTLNPTTNIDKITDFTSGVDTILLSSSIFTVLNWAGDLHPDNFRIGTSALDGNDFIIFNKTTGALYYDPDGTGATVQVQFSTLAGAPVVAATDFVVGF